MKILSSGVNYDQAIKDMEFRKVMREKEYQDRKARIAEIPADELLFLEITANGPQFIRKKKSEK